ncbi:hypothetical protein HYPSUDRAFT_168611 [Hypholoma sublateritium FD-334 SS-4]|uniref:Uncharacterized protein n=1 Tax=Hypholoma sublateritium (strain FD-334 SS-4) TaxID=945553 RepID=A0A0D2NQC6_HYPSF|nr:hypothetical protein HYPSUDRAFT_168611 [Hypholoma sublateritium FD-334 SS-4]
MASTELALERSLYVGDAIGAIIYGIQLTLFFHSTHYLLRGSRENRKRDLGFILYGFILALMVSIALATNFVFGQLMWIDRRNEPGGPPEFFRVNGTIWYQIFGTTAAYVGIAMSDALMLHRCYAITAGNPWLCIPSGIIFLASLALGIVSIIASASPNVFLLAGRPAQFGTAWISLSVAYNIIVTFIISVKLILASRRLKRIALPEYAGIYTSVAAIVIESAFPPSFIGIVFSVIYGLNNVSALAFSVAWGCLLAVSPQLIILRVARGTAWSQNTLNDAPISAIRFKGQPDTVNLGSDDSVSVAATGNLELIQSKSESAVV